MKLGKSHLVTAEWIRAMMVKLGGGGWGNDSRAFDNASTGHAGCGVPEELAQRLNLSNPGLEVRGQRLCAFLYSRK